VVILVKKHILLILIAAWFLCSCSTSTAKRTINIAVVGSPSVYSEYYEQGIKKAYEDVCEEYKDSGFEINMNIYDDKDDYETAERITAKLVNDDSITAIIASSSAEICANQAYQADKAGKVLICPRWIYDDTLSEGRYSRVFSLNYSSEQIGSVMENIAQNSIAKKWVVCYSDDKISRTEIKGFTDNEGVNVVDFVKINVLTSDFSKIIDRWKLLGIEGVVLVPYENEGFEIFYKLKEAMPNLYIISDSNLDNDNELQENRENFNNVYLLDSFYTRSEESEKFTDEESLDTWEVHGYNALRIIIDTAVKNNTNDSDEIAEILHKDGYDGELESYRFTEIGTLEPEIFSYIEITADDVILHTITAE